MLDDLVQAFCDGSRKALLFNLIKQENLSDEELLELKRLAEEPPPASDPSSGSAS
jgi:predicted transcriptional regulator